MSFNYVDHSGHSIVGSGLGRNNFSTPIFVSAGYYDCDYSRPTSLLASGITLLIIGIAATILGILSAVFRNPPLAITMIVLGALSAAAGIASIIVHCAQRKIS